MGPLIADRVKETTTTTGTGTVNLAGAASGFRTFVDAIGTGNTCFYTIVGGTEWEVGIGTVTDATPDTLSRTTVLASSNAGAAVNFSAGTKDVFCTIPADFPNRLAHPTDTVANLAAAQAGRLLLPSNGLQLYRDTGSALAPWGPIFPFTAPVSGDFAWINQGSATITTTFGGVHLACATTASMSLKVRKKSAPAAPYTITAAFLPAMPSDQWVFGLCFRQASDGKLHTFQVQQSGNVIYLTSTKMTDATTFSANYQLAEFAALTWNPVWLRIADDNSNRICSISADGQNWCQFHSVGRTDFLTADEVGWFINPQDQSLTVTTGVTIVHWKQA